MMVGSQLTPCKDSQYRSEVTNRCRNLGSDIAFSVPCAEGQERNPVSNRCRSVVQASVALTPCKENQERSSETNRCRTVTKISQADYAVQPVAKSNDESVGIIALVSIIAVALSYAVWEWRVELTYIYKKLCSFLHLSK
jgi:hypothetical protein